MKNLIPAIAVCAAASAALCGAAVAAPKPAAKLTMAQARAIALKIAPGKIADAEYENENGGWRYSFDIRQGARVHEIGVDANTGAIVENDFENPAAKD